MMLKITDMLRAEIDKGLINPNRLEEKVAAFLEMVNSKFEAFDVEKGAKQRVKFADMVKVSFMSKNIHGVSEKVEIEIMSPRLVKGNYVARCIMFSNGAYRGISLG